MKKKLLSLVLAGAMVASTSVSAFAEVESVANGKINGQDNKEYSTEVKIKGDVEDTSGQTKPGTLSVTVATAANFRVNSSGKVTGTNINVNNQGTDEIDVFAYKFIDTTPSSDITVQGKSSLTGQDRTHVSLSVKGNLATAYLGSEQGSSNGIYKNPDLTSSDSTALRIATVAPGAERDLELSGEVAKNAGEVTDPVNDQFTLVLKIAKTNKS